MDYQSHFTYLHLLKYKTRDESVEAKESFKECVYSHCVDNKQHHAGNEIFRSERCMNHIKDMHQGLTFSGFNDHHQNDQAEWCISLLQDLVR